MKAGKVEVHVTGFFLNLKKNQQNIYSKIWQCLFAMCMVGLNNVLLQVKVAK